jgi:glycosyltransferase involved in cell wall biosynthesis
MDFQRTSELRARISSSPDDHKSYLELADIYIKAGQHTEAYEHLSLLSERLPGSVDILVTAGMLAAKLERKLDALNCFEKAAAISPEDKNVQHNLGIINAALERVSEAEIAFRKVTELAPDEAEGFNDLGVVLAHMGKPEEARAAFEAAIDKNAFFERAVSNYAELCISEKRYDDGLRAVARFLSLVPESESMLQLREALEKLARPSGEQFASSNFVPKGLRIAFFATQDTFAQGILSQLAAHNEIKRFAGNTTQQLSELLDWADLAWFEWCDQLLIEATKLPKKCKMICRLHSYEAFTDMPAKVDWSKVDRLILVNPNVAAILDEYHSIPVKREIVYNGVDLDKFAFREKQVHGKKVCSLGFINYKKNPGLLLYCFKALHEYDPEFTFYVAGQHQDPRIKAYFDHMLKRLNIPVTFDNWVTDVPGYLSDKDFVISTSLFESFHYSIAEGMACGVLPLVHAWPGSENIYPAEYLFDTPADCVRLVGRLMNCDRNELARTNREYIADRFSLDRQIQGFYSVIESLSIQPRTGTGQSSRTQLLPEFVHKSSSDFGKVSIVIPTFNRAEYLEEAIESALKQTYRNCEVIVCDDASTDDTKYILERYKDRITALSHHRNRGVSAALNTCIRASSGNYISWLSSDDVYMPGKVEKQVSYLNDHPDIAMVYADFLYIDKHSTMGQRANVSPLTEGAEAQELFERNPINGCSVMFRRECIEKTGWFDEGLGGREGYTADGAMWHKMAHFFKMKFMNEPLLYYRVHDGNVANNTDTRARWETYRGYMRTWFREYEASAQERSPQKPNASRSVSKRGLNVAWIGVIDPGGISAMYKKAIERYTPHRMRILTHMESRGFDSDVVLTKTMWGGNQTMKDFSEVRRVADEADVLLFSAAVAPGASKFESRFFDTDDVPFGQINWKEYTAKKKCAVFFYGSTSIRRNYQWYLDLYKQKSWPTITCQPDIYKNMPGSSYVPILIDLQNERYHRSITGDNQITVVHSPTDRPIKNTDIFESVGRRITQRHPGVQFRLCENMGFDEAIKLKRTGNIAFDQLQIGDGYYCLSSVENSALGMVNIVHLDDFARKCIANSLGTDELPWYTPSTEEEVYRIVNDLVSDPTRLEKEQKRTYDWFREWWNEKHLIYYLTDFLERVYEGA